MMSLDFLQPPGEGDARGAHDRDWTLDLPDGFGEADLADSLVRELEAITAVVAGSVWVRRGEPEDGEPWREVTSEEIRRRDVPDW
jgi:hypothetical protein